jgi:hypothetical protein
VTLHTAPTTRLPRHWLWPARIGWLLVLLLAVWKLALGTPLIHAEKLIPCDPTVEDCANANSPTPDDAAALERGGISLQAYASWVIAFSLFETMIWISVGILIFALRSDDWMALIASAMMILLTSGYASDPIGRAYPDLGWLAQLGFSLQNVLLFLFVGLFPGGRFAPRWMKWYWLALVILALGGDRVFSGVIGARGWPADWIWVPGWLSFLILGPYSQIYRYRKVSSPTERLQTKWVVFGFSAMAGGILLGSLLQQAGSLPGIFISDFFFGLSTLVLPISIGVSMLRFRLWDIDVIIRKTLVYGALTAILALVYFGAVTLSQSLFVAATGEQSPVAIVISTLTIAALFGRLRQRIQTTIDRRFFRSKYNAQKTMEGFAASVRDEVELDQISAYLLAVVQETLQPEQVSLWLKLGERPRAKFAPRPERSR